MAMRCAADGAAWTVGAQCIAPLLQALTVALTGAPLLARRHEQAGARLVVMAHVEGVERKADGATGNAFNHDLAYNNCNGINGALAMRGSSAFCGQDLTYNLTLNGSLKKQCDLSIKDFDQRIQTNIQNPQNATITINSSMSAQCSSGSTTCTFTNTTYNVSRGATTFTSNCK